MALGFGPGVGLSSLLPWALEPVWLAVVGPRAFGTCVRGTDTEPPVALPGLDLGGGLS